MNRNGMSIGKYSAGYHAFRVNLLKLLVAQVIIACTAQCAQAQSGSPQPHISALEIPGVPWLPPGLEGGIGDVDLHSGTFRYDYPFTVPGGPRGMKPDLGLVYNSQFAGDESAGVGWSLPIGFITRVGSTGGAPMLDATDRFFLSMPQGGGRLVPMGDGTYRTEHDPHWKIHKGILRLNAPDGDPCYFIVTDKVGTRYYFGGRLFGDATSRCNEYPEGVGIVRTVVQKRAAMWVLTRIRDKFANEIIFKYDNAVGQYPRLATVSWGGSGLSGPMYKLMFIAEARPAQAMAAVGGAVLTWSHRLDKVVLAYGGGISWISIREWDLTYRSLPDSHRSFLSSIQVRDPSTGALLPATTFDYGSPSPSANSTWYGAGPFGQVSVSAPLYQRQLSDKRALMHAGAMINTVASAAGYGWVGNIVLGTVNRLWRPTLDHWRSRQSQGLMDMTGDGRPDQIIMSRPPGATGLAPNCMWVATNTGEGFGQLQYWGYNSCFNYIHDVDFFESSGESSVRQTMLDFDGDGLPDIVSCNRPDGSPGFADNWNVKRNTGSGFEFAGNWGGAPCTKRVPGGTQIGLGYSRHNNEIALPIDLNGDGWIDFLECADREAVDGIPANCRAYINSGVPSNAAFRVVNFNSPFPLIRARRKIDSGETWLTTSMLADMNGDGLPDLVFQERGNVECTESAPNWPACPGRQWKVRLNRGGQLEGAGEYPPSYYNDRDWPGIAEHLAIEHHNSDYRDLERGLVDINGDGLLDYAFYHGGNTRICANGWSPGPELIYTLRRYETAGEE
jgi:hypothetical protein